VNHNNKLGADNDNDNNKETMSTPNDHTSDDIIDKEKNKSDELTEDPNTDTNTEHDLASAVATQLSLSATSATSDRYVLLCDAGYALPREARPRKEKILAIARQMVNFIEWQEEQAAASSSDQQQLAKIQVVGCNDEATCKALQERTQALLGVSALPTHVTFTCDALDTVCNETEEAVYLSPDAPESMDLVETPPNVVIVGLLIDRRVQPNRSQERATKLTIKSKRWPLEQCFANIDRNEPLNVDTIMEGMQQWWWNCAEDSGVLGKDRFIEASADALERHARRHPSRPMHISTDPA
jgi:hypothetical protein